MGRGVSADITFIHICYACLVMNACCFKKKKIFETNVQNIHKPL